jgi:hypothetical protein
VNFRDPRFFVKEQIRFLTELVNLLCVYVGNPIVVKLCPLFFLISGLVLNLNQTVVMTSACTVSMMNDHTDKLILMRLWLAVFRRTIV